MKKALNAALKAVTYVLGLVGGFVLLVAAATIMPLSRAYHMGRLAAERDYQASTADILAGLAKALAKSGDEPVDAADAKTGAYL